MFIKLIYLVFTEQCACTCKRKLCMNNLTNRTGHISIDMCMFKVNKFVVAALNYHCAVDDHYKEML